MEARVYLEKNWICNERARRNETNLAIGRGRQGSKEGLILENGPKPLKTETGLGSNESSSF